MSDALNPLDHPVCLEVPTRLAPSHWAEHVPFAMWLVSAARPRVLVELGTFRGTSYCAFCQAIERLGLETRGFAVDTWEGDPHNGRSEPEVFEELRRYHDARYAGFSRLLKMTFDDAASLFEYGSIDLLHIDGYHTYEAVRHDFETWLPKMSARGVVLFHDTAERILDFGVYRLWEELEARYPSFHFPHEHGLGVLLVGSDPPEALRALAAATGEKAEPIRACFRELGRRARLQIERDEARRQNQELAADLDAAAASFRDERAALVRQCQERIQAEQALQAKLEEELLRLQAQTEEYRRTAEARETFIADLQQSLAWSMAQRFSRVSRRLAPAGSRRHGLIKRWAGRQGQAVPAKSNPPRAAVAEPRGDRSGGAGGAR